MSNAAKLKKKAAEFEQKKQFDKALSLYVEALEELGEDEEADVALFNRVGDLMLRQGNVGDAVTYYEKAVDLYAEGGFFNNAIALCNKILRQSPGRNSIYYKLGKISAKKGFKSDAKANFLEYADRMQKGGQIDEAFRALKEFADLCPDQDDIRLMLAEQLSRKDRKEEALEQLQLLYDRFEEDGRKSEAHATAERMKAIDPNVEIKSGGTQKKQKSSDLVFLDVSWEEPKTKAKPPGRKTIPTRPPAAEEEDLPPGLEPMRPSAPSGRQTIPEAESPVEDIPLMEPMPAADMSDVERTDVVSPLEGLMGSTEPGAAEVEPPAQDASLLGLESTSLTADEEEIVIVDPEPASPSEFANLRLDTPTSVPAVEPPEHDLALPGELPMLGLPADGSGELTLIMPEEEPLMPTATPRHSGDAFADLTPPIGRPTSEQRAPGPPVPPAEREEPHSGKGNEPQRPAARSRATEDLPLLEVDFGDAPPPEPDAEAAPEGLPELMTVEDLPAPVEEAPPRRSRSSTSILARSVDALRVRLADEVENWGLHRQLAEALLEDGDRDGGLKELESAMVGFERTGDLDTARSVADEIIRIDPNSVRHHQKRVEYAFRTQDKPRLIDAYVELADALMRAGQAEKSRSVYQRVLELAPDDPRATAALGAFAQPEPPAKKERKEKPAARSTTHARRYTAEVKRAAVNPEPPPLDLGSGDDDFVNLGDWLRDDNTPPKSTRMVVEEQEPTGDEQADFADMLRKFKQGIAENVEEEDFDSHYDLGVAYKEMGLLDEAIAEFQKALRGAERRVRAYEALGQCFLEKKQYQVAHTILSRALAEKGMSDDQLVGVLYLLGYASEALQNWKDAVTYYQRVFAVDIQFRDVSDRLTSIEKVAR
jgi:tetratricopeptide (TPR) repeat protein